MWMAMQCVYFYGRCHRRLCHGLSFSLSGGDALRACACALKVYTLLPFVVLDMFVTCAFCILEVAESK